MSAPEQAMQNEESLGARSDALVLRKKPLSASKPTKVVVWTVRDRATSQNTETGAATSTNGLP